MSKGSWKRKEEYYGAYEAGHMAAFGKPEPRVKARCERCGKVMARLLSNKGWAYELDLSLFPSMEFRWACPKCQGKVTTEIS